MAARTLTFDRLVVQRVILTRNESDPTKADITYEISATDGTFPETRTFAPANIPAATQTQLNNLYDLALSAARAREGL